MTAGGNVTLPDPDAYDAVDLTSCTLDPRPNAAPIRTPRARRARAVSLPPSLTTHIEDRASLPRGDPLDDTDTDSMPDFDDAEWSDSKPQLGSALAGNVKTAGLRLVPRLPRLCDRFLIPTLLQCAFVAFRILRSSPNCWHSFSRCACTASAVPALYVRGPASPERLASLADCGYISLFDNVHKQSVQPIASATTGTPRLVSAAEARAERTRAAPSGPPPLPPSLSEFPPLGAHRKAPATHRRPATRSPAPPPLAASASTTQPQLSNSAVAGSPPAASGSQFKPAEKAPPATGDDDQTLSPPVAAASAENVAAPSPLSISTGAHVVVEVHSTPLGRALFRASRGHDFLDLDDIRHFVTPPPPPPRRRGARAIADAATAARTAAIAQGDRAVRLVRAIRGSASSTSELIVEVDDPVAFFTRHCGNASASALDGGRWGCRGATRWRNMCVQCWLLWLTLLLQRAGAADP